MENEHLVIDMTCIELPRSNSHKHDSESKGTGPSLPTVQNKTWEFMIQLSESKK